MVDRGENRYIYKSSCEQLRKRSLVLNILNILRESDKKRMTKNEIINIGRKKHRDWPKDPNTIFRALNSMSKCELLTVKHKGKGQAFLWRLNNKQISDRELLQYEIKQLGLIVSKLPRWAFEVEYFKNEIDDIWQKIRNALVVLQNQHITSHWIYFRDEEQKMLSSKKYKLIDRQISIIFLFCLYCPKEDLLDTWFDRSQIIYRVKADFDLLNIFIRNFYPKCTKEKMFRMLDKHRLNATLSKKLWNLIIWYFGILNLQSEYELKLFDKNKFNVLEESNLEEFEETISHEKLKVFKERIISESYLLDLFKKKEYSLDMIDKFISEYKKDLE